MPAFHLGIICGVVFGALSVAAMVPMSFPDNRAAMLAAFFNRFAIGFVIGLLPLGRIGWATGLVIGILLSLPEAIVTKAYVPIMVLGTVGGGVIGWIIGAYGR